MSKSQGEFLSSKKLCRALHSGNAGHGKKKERTVSACVRTYAQEDDDDYRFLGALFKKDFQKKL